MIPEIIWQSWATFNQLRKLGFLGSDIFIIFNDSGASVELRHQGKTFGINVCHLPVGWTKEHAAAEFRAFTAKLNAGEIPDAELARADALWLSRNGAFALIKALQENGFTVGIPEPEAQA